jgi:exopolysaccharide/PEP-CTERM locus tyrosine autokinase
VSIIEIGLKKLADRDGATDGRPRAEPSFGVIREVASPGDGTTGSAGAVPRRVVHLDRAALINAGFLPPEQKQGQIAGQFRHIKRPLLAAALGRGTEPLDHGRMIMVTSSLPNEGKTFISINLALSISLERDVSVVLVDADVAKTHVSRLFGLEAEAGLLDAVRDESLDIESLILPTDIPQLSVLPAGRPTEMATELLASFQMESVLAKVVGWQTRKRVVIFDSPPLLLTSESRVLAQHMGQVVVVVRAGLTPQQAVFDSIDCLAGNKSVTLLLNQSESVSHAGYNYRDGVYGGEYGRDVDRRP